MKVAVYQAQKGITAQGSAARISPSAMTVAGDAASGFAATALDATARVLQRQQDADDNAWVSSVTAAGAKDWAQRLNASKQTAPEGADGFAGTVQKDFEDYRTKTLKDAPSPQAAEIASQRFNRLGLSLFQDALSFEATSKRTKRMTDFDLGINDLAGTAFVNPGQTAQLIAQARGDLAAAEGTWMLPTDVSAQRQKIPTMIAEAALRGRVGQDPEGVLAVLKSDDDSVRPLDPQRRSVLASAARAEIGRRKMASNQARQALKNRINDLKGVVEAGFNPGEDKFTALETSIAGFGDPQLSANISALRDQLAFQTEIRAWTPTMVQGWINEERGRLKKGSGVSGGEADRVDLAEKVLTSMSAGLAQDPLSWATRAGVADIQPVAFSGDGALESMQARKDAALGLAQYYGTPPRLLTDEEEVQLKSYISGATVDQQVALAFSLNTGFKDQATGVFARIAGGDPLFAHAGGLAAVGTAQAGTARDVLFGRQVLKAGNKVLPPTIDMNQWTVDGLGGALSQNPKTRAALIESTKAIYATKFMQRGASADLSSTYFDETEEDLWSESLQLAAGGAPGADGKMRGGIGAWNDQSILLPTGVDQSGFDALMSAVIDDDLARLGGAEYGNGAPLTAADIADARLVDYGLGQYLIDMDGDGAGLVRGDGPNGYFVLDVARLSQVILARNNKSRDGVEVGAVTDAGGG